ncbi:MAG: penicillin-binding transpeptidase domain-containing protein [Chloroflexota bacterium]
MIPFRQIFVIVTLFALAACAPMEMLSGGGSGSGVAIVAASPRAVAENFLSAWNASDVDAMYGAISVRSQGLYTPEAFNRFYTNLAEDVGLNEVAFTVHNMEMQGTSAVVDYDIMVDSAVFGQIEDTGRKMRLVQENDRWKVAWSTLDIFDGYTSGASLTVVSEDSRRESIYDRDGDVLVQDNGTVSVIYVSQQNMSNVADCNRLLADLLYTRTPEIAALGRNYLPDANYYVGEIDESVEIEYRQQLLEVCGTSRELESIYTRRTRQYVGQGAAVHVTGYIGPVPQEDRARWIALGYTDNDLVGLAGIENVYNEELNGRPPRVLQIIEPGGTVLAELGRAQGKPPEPVYLTIDRDLQISAARTVAWGYNYAINNWGRPDISPGAAAVVMDVKTGGILAMVSYPTFQPGLFNPDSEAPDRGEKLAAVQGNLSNRAVSERYSPGSIFKIVSTAAFLDTGLTEPGDNFFCDLIWDGSQTYGDTSSPRLDWRFTDGLDATGNIVPSQALTSSCDPFYYEFSSMGFLEESPNLIPDYAARFGLVGQPGMGIFREATAVIPVPPTVDEAINNSIGQGGTQISALQAAMMTTAAANGGTLYRPYLVEQVGDQRVAQPQVVNDLNISPEALASVQRGMCDVVGDPVHGTAFWIFSDNPAGNAQYRACGKTGTAQTTTYPNAWFVAYAPADDPEVAVAVVSQNSREGSDVAAPMVRRILDAYFGYEPVDFPEWWAEDYVPLTVPDNGVAGG